MAFRDFPAKTTSEGIISYTCNSPDEKTLEKHWIKSIWEVFWCAAKEVLLIPFKVFAKFWKILSKSEESNTITCEHLMRDLSK